MNLKNCPNDNRGGLFQRCPDIGFFQYQVGWFLQIFLIWLTCRVSILIFFPDFLDQHGINILEWQAHQDINIRFL